MRLEVYKCDRCSTKADEEEYAKRWMGLRRLSSSEDDRHLCGECKAAFYRWLEKGETRCPRLTAATTLSSANAQSTAVAVPIARAAASRATARWPAGFATIRAGATMGATRSERVITMPPTDVSDEALEKIVSELYPESSATRFMAMVSLAKRIRSLCRAAAVEVAEGLRDAPWAGAKPMHHIHETYDAACEDILSDLRLLFPADDAEEGGEDAG